MKGFGGLDLDEMSDASPTNWREADESTLVRYLLGRASEEETEQLDEMSIVDEELARRLRAVEHDLVDAYVNGELTGDALEAFRSQYLRSPSGVAAVEFAEALRGYPRTTDGPTASRAPARLGWFVPWRSAAALFLVTTSAWLLIDDLRLRDRMAGARETNTALDQRARRLQDDLNQQQSAARAAAEELARAREALTVVPPRAEPSAESAGVLAVALVAMNRGGGEVPRIAVPQGIPTVVLILPLVAVEFTRYEAALTDATSGRVIWRSGRLPAPPASDRPTLPVAVRARLFEPRAYTLELFGISARGQAEPLDSYAFRVEP
jgi:hypothetical protein